MTTPMHDLVSPSIVLLAVLVFLVTAPVQATAQNAETGQAATVEVMEKEGIGSYLVDAEGRSLYIFTSDTTQGSTCYDACAQAWPPYTTQGRPEAGERVSADMLDTITREGGTTQVTYNGWQLYYFVKDTRPGDIRGQDIEGFGAEWYLISPEGTKIEAEGAGS